MKNLLKKTIACICAAGMLIGTCQTAFAEEYTELIVPTEAEESVFFENYAGGEIEPEFVEMTEEDLAAAERDTESIRKSLENAPVTVSADPYFDHDYTKDYFYDQLTTKAEKDFYKALYDSCMDFLNSNADVEAYCATASFNTNTLSYDDAGKIARGITYANPQFFFCRGSGTYNHMGSNYTYSMKCGDSFKNGKKRQEVKNVIENKTSKWLPQINAQKTELAKISKIVDIIVNNVTYDNDALADVSATADYNQTIAGSIYKGTSVCAGYSMMFTYLCHAAGISDCIYINAVGHAYNAVKLDGTWYLVDTTFIDRDKGSFKNMSYFLRSYKTYMEKSPTNHEIEFDQYRGFSLPEFLSDYTSYPDGDINCDGYSDITDKQEILDVMINRMSSYSYYTDLKQLDVNNDGNFDMKDLIWLDGEPTKTEEDDPCAYIRVTSSRSVADIGETFNVNIEVESNFGLSSFGMLLVYDPNVFEVVSDDMASVKLFGDSFNYAYADVDYVDSQKVHHIIAYTAAGGDDFSTDTGKLCSVKFRVKEGAVEGETYKLSILKTTVKETLGKYCSTSSWRNYITDKDKVTIGKLPEYNGDPAETPVMSSVTEDSIEIENQGDKYEYICSTEKLDDKTAKDADWTENTLFDGLKPNKTYYIYSRVKATDEMQASPISGPLAVTTSKTTINGDVLKVIIPDEVHPADVIRPEIEYTGKYTLEDLGKVTLKWSNGTSGETYKVSKEDIGKTVSVTVSFENGDGSVKAEAEVTMIPGDIDYDGDLDTSDISEVKQMLIETDALPSVCYDVNGDTYFDIRDLSALIYMSK